MRDYSDGDAFEKSIGDTLKVSAVRVIKDPTKAITVVKEFVELAGEVAKFEQAQATEREKIAAKRDIAIKQLENQQEAFLTYLDKTFDERADAFKKLFDVVDDALQKDNIEELSKSLDGVLTLAQSSPFKDLCSVEAASNALSDPAHEWDF
jgi:hypothetical protein